MDSITRQGADKFCPLLQGWKFPMASPAETTFHCYLLNVLLSLGSLACHYLLLNTLGTSFYLKQRLYVQLWLAWETFMYQGDTFHNFPYARLAFREKVNAFDLEDGYITI